MSDTLTLRKYRQQVIHPVGMNPWRKYHFLFFILILAAAAGIAYQVSTTGILAEENPQIHGQVLERVNLERQAANIRPVRSSDSLTYDAIRISREVRISPLTYKSGNNPAVPGRTNILVVPRIAYAIPGYDSLRQVFSGSGSDESSFRDNAFDPSVNSIGIGVSGDLNNYYIVTMWV